MEKSEKKLLFDQKKAELLIRVSKRGEKMSSTEKDSEKRVSICRGATALSEMFSKHIEYYFCVEDLSNFFSAIDSTIERLEEELQKEKESNQIVAEEKNLNQPDFC